MHVFRYAGQVQLESLVGIVQGHLQDVPSVLMTVLCAIDVARARTSRTVSLVPASRPIAIEPMTDFDMLELGRLLRDATRFPPLEILDV